MRNKIEVKLIFSAILLLFTLFLIVPIVLLLIRSLQTSSGVSFVHYMEALRNKELLVAFSNSLKVSAVTAVIATVIAFSLAYAVHATNIHTYIKKMIQIGIVVPMLLPTITYGFAIMYSYGNQGLITKLLGDWSFNIYGFNGLLMGYVIYTVPAAFLLIHNAFTYVDKKFIIVSKLMGDNVWRSFVNTIFRPLSGAIGGAFVLSFILSFTDFGIPASIGGTYTVVSTQLYQVMLGSIPNFNEGAVIAIFMLIPAVFGVLLLSYLERFNFHSDKASESAILPNKWRDVAFSTTSFVILSAMSSVFVVMFIAPFLMNYPYNNTFTLQHVTAIFADRDLMSVYKNSLLVAVMTAIFGTIFAYAAALVNVRSSLKRKGTLDTIAIVTNTVPGMVLGLSYLLLFSGSNLKGTFIILIVCNIIHYFTTPYLMVKNAFSKMNPSWETTGELLGDSWFKTVYRVLLPNSFATIIEMFSYFFVNAMVTISGIIFLISAHTSVVASKIKELQHFAKFNEIFVLSLLIFFTNLAMKLVCDYLQKRALSPKTKTYNVKVGEAHVQKT